MEYAIVLKIIFSFLIAGTWITAATLFAEKAGSKIGGMIANLPSNILVALLFVALVQTPQFAAQSALTVPLGLAIDNIFLFVFVIFLEYGLPQAIIGSLASWFAFAFLAGEMKIASLLAGLLLYVVTASGFFLIMEHKFKFHAVRQIKKKYTPKQMLARFFFAGSVVATTVSLSTFAGTFWTGMFSIFPAVFLSTMTILAINQGRAFAQSLGKIMMISSSNVVIYGMAVHLTYPVFGTITGTIISYIAALAWVLMLSPFLKKAR